MHNFWKSLPTPFFIQAPMEDVTDAAFRTLIARYSGERGKHVAFTEFTSADGLVLAPEKGQKSLRKKLLYSEIERPIVAQLFSAIPDRMERASAIVAELGFDGIDINMGCPAKEIEKSGCGSAMIKNPALAVEIIRAAKRGGGGLPVSVKTRIGYASNEISTWVPTLLGEGIANLTIHARTRNEMSDVPARWEHVAEAVAIRDAMGVSTRITGNGDVLSLADAREKIATAECDGAMLGRAIYGNPWLFSEHIPTPSERIQALIEHLRLFDELLGGTVNYATMKKHFKAYISGWDDAKELRVRLMETNSTEEAIGILVSE
jgi:nifR3 family TIM-barrel protein